MIEADAYDSGDYADAWTDANAGASNSDVTSNTDDEEDSIFHGGFLGKCEEEQSWQWEEGDEERRCSGNIPWQQAVMLPEIQGGDAVGLIVMPYNDMQDRTLSNFPNFVHPRSELSLDESVHLNWHSYSTAVEDAEHREESDSLEMLNARCWPGGASDRPDFDSAVEGEDYIEGSVPVSSEEPFGIYGEIDTSATSTYTCNWSYETQLHDVETTGDVVELHNDASIEEQFPSGFQRSPSDVRQDFFNRHEGLQDSYERDNFLSQMQEWESVQNVA